MITTATRREPAKTNIIRHRSDRNDNAKLAAFAATIGAAVPA